MKVSKKFKKIKDALPLGKTYAVQDALKLVKDYATAKFNEAVDVAVVLGIDAKKSDQAVRSAVVLPHGTGKSVRIAVFAQGANAEAAKEAGADVVGFEDLAASMKAGDLNYDVVIASPDAMRIVGQLGTVLGPRGLMPNPKVGTVTADVAGAVKNAKSGQVRYRSDKAGIVHASIGRADFTAEQLKDNLKVFVDDLKRVKPATSKGVFIKKIALSSTMGPGLAVDVTTVD
jgi:large subunit ribosomal protein L1